MIRTSTVTVAASAPLVALDDVRVDLGIEGNDADAVLARAISRASAAVISYIGFNPGVETIVDRFDAESGSCGGSQLLQLSKYPVVSIASIIDGCGTLSLDGFRLYSRSGTVYRLGAGGTMARWSALPVAVTYTAGYVDTPEDIAGVIVQMVRADFHAHNRDPAIRSDSTEGIGIWTFFDRSTLRGVTADASAILDRYRDLGMA